MPIPASGDKFRTDWLFLVNQPNHDKLYEWGEVPWDRDSSPYDADCSGGMYATWTRAGVPSSLLGGRQTAHDYYRLCKPIAGAPQVGDAFFLLTDGHAHHIGACIGAGETAEARGEAFGIIRSTVAGVNQRGAVWRRLPGVTFSPIGGNPMTNTATEAYYALLVPHGNDQQRTDLIVLAHASYLNVNGEARGNADPAKVPADLIPGRIIVHARSSKAADYVTVIEGRRIPKGSILRLATVKDSCFGGYAFV